jgi:hypothetical protein
MSVTLLVHPRAGGQEARAGASGRPRPARGVTISEVKALGFPSQRAKAERHRLSPTALRCLGGPKVSTISTMPKESMR